MEPNFWETVAVVGDITGVYPWDPSRRDLHVVAKKHLHRILGVFRLSTGWWFQTSFIFHNIWDNPYHWRTPSFFKMVKNTNQIQLGISKLEIQNIKHWSFWSMSCGASPQRIWGIEQPSEMMFFWVLLGLMGFNNRTWRNMMVSLSKHDFTWSNHQKHGFKPELWIWTGIIWMCPFILAGKMRF